MEAVEVANTSAQEFEEKVGEEISGLIEAIDALIEIVGPDALVSYDNENWILHALKEKFEAGDEELTSDYLVDGSGIHFIYEDEDGDDLIETIIEVIPEE